MSAISYQLDATGFYVNGDKTEHTIACNAKTYDPLKHFAAMIPVDLSLEASLQFDEEKREAERIKNMGGQIVWKLDFNLSNACFFEGIFNAYYHGLKVFTEKLLQIFPTVGCSLFEGSCDLSSLITWNAGHRQNFLEWLEDTYQTPSRLLETQEAPRPLGDITSFQEMSLEMFDVTPFCRHLKNLYLMNILSAYLHRLAAALPEELFVFVSLDARCITHPAYLYQLLSKERFSYLHLAVKGSSIPLETFVWKEDCIMSSCIAAKVGVCFPNDPYCLQTTMHQLKKVFLALADRNIAYRIIPEYLLTSSWEGLDDILFLHKALSSQGKRILQGFSITGGRLIYLDSPVGLEGEVAYTELYCV